MLIWSFLYAFMSYMLRIYVHVFSIAVMRVNFDMNDVVYVPHMEFIFSVKS